MYFEEKKQREQQYRQRKAIQSVNMLAGPKSFVLQVTSNSVTWYPDKSP